MVRSEGERGGGKVESKNPANPIQWEMDNGRHTMEARGNRFLSVTQKVTHPGSPRAHSSTRERERETKKKARKESERGRASKSNLSLAAQLIFFRGESALLCLRKRLAQNTLAELKHFILSLVRLLEHRNALFQVGN